ncbi:Pex18p SKDI_08G2070 [Saccharomyces kudriavzevii IFO 1802]|uniref:Uncharacterized protein n=2 Tax=Saccharomyces kudriavzevii (strain ATCC MYA-4449 / AS 2.2408 / CBS 8840 / NBRC 1802 / NCYC 2889) TaxID=226230 RepID=A0AA35JLF9_SACK1|nr:uncharacterized protein SKDI_08G2070 [Saccharomyces kudriavzevii IFO 1802]EJT43258.1 PEX18-like protein [Saccharomyces kudriavzevii IFO 1802]CAI4064041.1 hypothetical protein SKDI_08G2070 [Saccharomyces kudriavzevii IFO 1802]
MNATQCQANAVQSIVNRAEKGAFSGGEENTSSFGKIQSRNESSPILNNIIEQRFLQYSSVSNQLPSYADVPPRILENQKSAAPEPNNSGTSWSKDFKHDSIRHITLPIQNEFANLNLNKEPHMIRTGPHLGFSSHKYLSMTSFPVIDHQIPEPRTLEFPIGSEVDSLINAEFLEMEDTDLQEEGNTQEENLDTGLEQEKAAMKSLASDIVEFCGNSSADEGLTERLISSKFVGLMGNISSGSVILKKNESTEKDLQKHVGFCFERTGTWTDLEFRDVEDRTV